MSSLLVVLLLAGPIVGLLAAAAYAVDLCLTFDDQVLVIKDVQPGLGSSTLASDEQKVNAQLAKENKCTALSGFLFPGFAGPPSADFANVSICTNSTGTHTTVIATGLLFNSQTTFPLPIPASGATQFVEVPATSTQTFGTSVDVCAPNVVPVP